MSMNQHEGPTNFHTSQTYDYWPVCRSDTWRRAVPKKAAGVAERSTYNKIKDCISSHHYNYNDRRYGYLFQNLKNATCVRLIKLKYRLNSIKICQSNADTLRSLLDLGQFNAAKAPYEISLD